MAKIIEVPADIHEDVDTLFQTVDREADALVQELLQDRLRALRDLIDSALLANYRRGYDQGITANLNSIMFEQQTGKETSK